MHLKSIKNNRKMTTIVPGWTWKHQHLDRLCPKSPPDTDEVAVASSRLFKESTSKGMMHVHINVTVLLLWVVRNL
jgi:hypothetical protein